ncbi:probable 39S ribosomal protein L49, mitochondrial [Aricia agestis]|uniref:probable 39S ribosomal protein L49, mitochondrial n=1 Tax=Aricia agestis TaxID=91739 RepID=UPI001C201E1D|nr:probable 39S ribosomal protein L49, mitochondrial [Aricia agestis]
MATVLRSRCAFVRFLVEKTGRILNNSTDFGTKLPRESISVCAARTYSNYADSPFVRKVTEQYEFDITKDPADWKFVERLLPLESIPQFTPKEKYPSGWIPPKEEAKNLPYFIARTKNHEVPIYLNRSYRGQRQISKIKHIEGDIWAMNDEIKAYLKNTHKRYVETRVHELGKFIEVKGDFVTSLHNWAYSKGY